MADKAVTIRTRKFMTNRLLSRKQFVSFRGFFCPPPFSGCSFVFHRLEGVFGARLSVVLDEI